MDEDVAALAKGWLDRLPPEGWCDLRDSLERYGELRDAVAPPTFSVLVTEGVVARDRGSGHLEAAIEAHLVPPGREPPREEDEADSHCGAIDLALDTKTRELRLSSLDLPAEAQTAGLGSIVMSQLAALGEDLGLESIHLQAGNVGRWAWMRCGFDFDDPVWLEATVTAGEKFALALGREVDLSAIEHAWDFVELPGTVTAEEIQTAGGAAIRSSGRPISLGKALVLGPVPSANPWWGRLRLDPTSEGRVRLDEYVSRRGSSG